jgi:peptide deformylase
MKKRNIPFKFSIGMSVLPIITGADTPILRSKTKPVPKVTKELQKLLKDMQETTIAADGLGIAAPQIGRTERVCIVQMGEKLVALVNPYITFRSEEQESAEEGCLSLPGIWAQVPRSTSIKLEYVDAKGSKQERMLLGMDARVVQHEVDHLEGKLIVDYGPHGKVL